MRQEQRAEVNLMRKPQTFSNSRRDGDLKQMKKKKKRTFLGGNPGLTYRGGNPGNFRKISDHVL
jgi:hypothetical protein